MKYLLIIGDGMADESIPALAGKTPLDHLRPEGMARVAAGEVGRFLSCPKKLPPGSDVAFLSILGCDPLARYAGRSPLEAAGMGIDILPGQTAFRMNLVSIAPEGYPDASMLSHNGGGIDGEDAKALIDFLIEDSAFSSACRALSMKIFATNTFRHLAVMDGVYLKDFAPPHDLVGRPVSDGRADETLFSLQQRAFDVLSSHPINARRAKDGLLPANSVWFWGAGTASAFPNFEDKFAHRAAVISAVPLVKGIARLCGMAAPDVKGATGLIDTDYEAKVECALTLFDKGYDFVLLHIEAPDELSHDGDLDGKLEAISRVDARVVKPMLNRMQGDFRLLLMPDHYTLLSTRTHDATPVPFAIFDSRRTRGARPFTEALCENEPITSSDDALLRRLFAPCAR